MSDAPEGTITDEGICTMIEFPKRDVRPLVSAGCFIAAIALLLLFASPM